MPIYMDVHSVPGVNATNVAAAHRQDLFHQDEYGCKCMTYWIDEGRESIFCLIDAPDKDAVKELHRKAHGMVPNKIIEVSSSVVQSFLGRIYDPEDAIITQEGLKVFSDPSFRILLLTTTTDPVLLEFNLGKEKANELLQSQNKLIRNNISAFNGSEAEHSGAGFIVSFQSAMEAVSCALAIMQDTPQADADLMGFKMSITGGEPIEESHEFFGDAIKSGRYLCTLTKFSGVTIDSSIKQLVTKDQLHRKNEQLVALDPNDEETLQKLFGILEKNWQNAAFDVEDFGKETAMSKSQLYRKTMALTGLSPNLLLKEFRLEKAKEMMNEKRYTIAQITFDAGFTSPSYFTKCFKKKYGLLPMSYMEMLH